METKHLLNYCKAIFAFFLLLNTQTISAQIGNTFPDISTKTIDQTKEIGTIEGGQYVNLDGSMGYTIPIAVPDGINGIAPNISINYNSFSGNGLFGWGWNISAISAISLGNTDLYHDGFINAVSLSSVSGFNFNGQKLQKLSGASYRTFENSSNKITGTGSVGNYTKFTVETNNGLILELGGTTNSKIANTSGITLSWLLNKVSDKYGNYAEYQYTVLNSETVLDKIIYTKNDATGITPATTLQFSYLLRADINKFFVNGTNTPNLEVEQKNVLDNIYIVVENEPLSTYQFKYTNTGEYTYLTEVIEKGYEIGGAEKQLNSTQFKYGDAPVETENFTATIAQNTNTSDVFTGDFNGDGFSDICTADYTSDAFGKMYSALHFYEKIANQNSFQAAVNQSLPLTTTIPHYSAAGTLTLYGGIEIADTDGDGKDEVVFGLRAKTTTNKVYMLGCNIYRMGGISTNFNTDGVGLYTDSILSPAFMVAGDFDGDGKDDIITTDRRRLVYHSPGDSIFNVYIGQSNYNYVYYDTKQFDNYNFDGDGKDELYIFSDADAFTIKNLFFNPSGINLNDITSSDGELNKTVYFGDFNGDNKSDYISLCATNPTIQFSNGKTTISATFTFTETLNMTNIYNGSEFVRVADYNGDGKADIAHYYTASSFQKVAIYYSLGTSFKRIESTTNFYTASPYFGDFNGDGRAETVHYEGANNLVKFIQYRPKGKERLLTTIKDGFLRTTTIDYKLFTEGGSFYTYIPPTTNIYPLRIFQPRLYGVDKITVPNGTGDLTQTTSTNYQYQNAKLHLSGKGFVGFEVHKTIDNATTLVNEKLTTRLLDVPNSTLYNFAITETKTYKQATAAQLISNSVFTVEGTDCLTGDNYCSKYKYIATNDNIKDIHNITQIYEDSLGNTLNYTQTTNGNLLVVKRGFADWVNGPSWQLSKPQTIYDTITKQGQTPYITKTTFEYNTKGQISKQTQFANDLSKAIITDLGYNATYGQLINETTTVPGELPRTNQFDYKPNQRTINTIKNAQNEVVATVTAYDKRFNTPTAVTGYYANQTNTATYDAFGKIKTSTKMPNNITTTYEYGFDILGKQLYYAKAIIPNSPDIKTYHDAFDRTIKSETTDFAGTPVMTTTAFNALGQTSLSIMPDATGATNTTNYSYNDPYFRPTQVSDNFSTVNYTYANPAAGQYKTITTILGGEWKESTTNAIGQLIIAKDAGGELNYTYNSQGLLKSVSLDGTNVSTMDYDPITGYQTALTEPNSGTTSYLYNGFGELKQQIMSGATTTLAYDVLGRIITRTDPDGIFTYSYVPTGNGKNQLLNIKKNGIIDQDFTYDTWHRPISANQRIDGIGYTTSLEYNTYNDVTKIIYPQSFAVDYQYNADGFLQKILRGGTSTIIYQTNTANKLGQITNYKLGNNPTSSITYQANGMPQRYLTTGIQDLNMVFNTNNGNLTSRTDAINNQTEAFTYEAAIDRLSSISTNGGSPLLIEYLNNGNINKKYDAGDYGYDANKINAVTNVTQLCSGTPQQLITPQTITYTHFNKPISIKQNFPTNTPRYELTFDYNSDHDRIKTILKTNGSSTPTATRYFVGNYEKELKAGITRHIYYIQAPTGLACIAVKQGTNAPQYYYTYTDHLGSIVAITNGSTLWKQSFDAFGRQRNPANWNDYTTIPSITLNGFVLDRGYTGHQHLKEFGIINMNGRLYDPIVGRMLNVDNFVQDPSSSQAFNRYSYVVNNPLKYTDPSGWNREDRADRKQEREYRRWERHTSIYIGSEIDDNGDDTEINYIWLYDRGGIGGEGRGNYNHSTDGYNHGTNNSVSGGVSNYTQALRPITLIVGRNPIGKALTWSYPYDNGKIYEIPTYQLTVSGSTPSGTKVIKNFEVIRFGVNGDSKGNLSMVGLADYQTYIIKKWISDYKVHSAPSKEDGAWQITGNYLIHDGPDKPMSEFYATAGCIEICGGPQGFVMFNSYLLNLSGALTKEQLANSGLLKIIYLQAARPAIKTH